MRGSTAMRGGLILNLGSALALAALGCGAKGGYEGADGGMNAPCTLGDREPCQCADGRSGAKTCRTGGVFSACLCLNVGGNGDGDDDGGTEADADTSGTGAGQYGDVCHVTGITTDCAPGLICYHSNNVGVCTKRCVGPSEAASNGCRVDYEGPGLAACSYVDQQNNWYCGFYCGENFNLPPDCPANLRCIDQIRPTASGFEVGTDGKLDSCAF